MIEGSAIELDRDNEEEIKRVVATYGPVSVAIYATLNLKHYSEGVFANDTCSSGELNHAVLIVGYGTHREHGDYWLIKNSWSQEWGEKGFFRMKRGVNMCKIAEFPIIAKF